MAFLDELFGGGLTLRSPGPTPSEAARGEFLSGVLPGIRNIANSGVLGRSKTAGVQAQTPQARKLTEEFFPTNVLETVLPDLNLSRGYYEQVGNRAFRDPGEAADYMIKGVGPSLMRNFQSEVLPTSQMIFAQAGAGRSGQQASTQNDLLRKHYSDPLAEAVSRAAMDAFAQGNQAQLNAASGLGNLGATRAAVVGQDNQQREKQFNALTPNDAALQALVQQGMAIQPPEETVIAGRDPGALNQILPALLLMNMLGGGKGGSGGGGILDLITKGGGALAGWVSKLFGGGESEGEAVGGSFGNNFRGYIDPQSAFQGSGGGSGAGSSVADLPTSGGGGGGMGASSASGLAMPAAKLLAGAFPGGLGLSSMASAPAASTAAAPALEAAMASYAPAAAASGAGAGLGAGVTGGMFDAAATGAGLMNAAGGLTALGGAGVLAAPALIGVLGREVAPYAHEALNSINPSKLIGGASRATPQEAGDANMQTLATLFSGATGTPVNVAAGGGLQASSPEAESLFRQMWSEAQASGIPVGPELNRWAMQWLAQRGYQDPSLMYGGD